MRREGEKGFMALAHAMSKSPITKKGPFLAFGARIISAFRVWALYWGIGLGSFVKTGRGLGWFLHRECRTVR